MSDLPPNTTHHHAPGPIARAASLPFLAIIWLYRFTLSPFVGGQCRHSPSCSRYALEAYRIHGPIRGSLLAAARILRCNPFSKGGYDPVPLNEPPTEKRQQQASLQAQTTHRTDPTSMHGQTP